MIGTGTGRSRMVAALIGLALLAGCADLADPGMPRNMPIAGDKFAGIRQGMTYAEFQQTFGDGWMSLASGTDAKYWFFDDGRTVIVPAEVWKTGGPLKYRVIGLVVAAEPPRPPILPSGRNDATLTTQR